MAGAVGDDPVPGHELRRFRSLVRDRDGVRKNQRFCPGCECSGAYSDSTCTRIPRVTASDMNISSMIVGNQVIGRSGDRVIWKFGNLEIWNAGNFDPTWGCAPACAHANVIVSERGSTFYLCARSKSDPAFPQIPAAARAGVYWL